ncbi:hypothetical protein SELSPUOL_00741 [Selenomonas sputigena ATCC 35185]|uniref:Lipoprotein n=1 Tax=Selenomonas sputigena (strain ATCC 35185 / DSM 20758 / CCUG 44933 / VPI D19B-28) TaxID=546271 RepID=C9LTF8_SELS3|nr:hypothetical protein SELSPUOL_00741 [Selenomonas sputigena ATCC 35185]
MFKKAEEKQGYGEAPQGGFFVSLLFYACTVTNQRGILGAGEYR